MNFKIHKLDKSIPIPLYYQLKQVLLGEIKSGNLKAGDMIPNETELCKIFEISRISVRQAVLDLVKEGYLFRQKGVGTFVAEPKIDLTYLSGFESFNNQVAAVGKMPGTKVLRLEQVPTNEDVQRALGLNSGENGENVIWLQRLRFVDHQPVALVDSYLPFKECSFIMDHNLNEESLYKVLSQNPKTTVYKVKRTITAVLATKDEMKYLDLKSISPIQMFTNIAYNKAGLPIEFCISKYRGDKSEFMVEVLVEK